MIPNPASFPIRACPQCQSPLPPDAPNGLCPECLMKAGLLPTEAFLTQPPSSHGRLPRPGEQFGGYFIERELGRGGMGAVYAADELESGRRVALKVLNHRLDSPDARARFLREGRLAASVNHPNSVYVYGTEEIDGAPVIAMELVPGGTLLERVQRNGPMPVGAAVDAILQVVAGLEAAQAIGILHRDVKPANCFEDANGVVKIGDFGLSISTEARGVTELTLEGSFLGTPAFCSPEQLRGEELNARSDLYSVGVTLFYLLTGKLPFEGKNTAQLFANALEKPAPSPRQFRPDLPPNLVPVILRCLEKTPGDRYANYAELRQALLPFSSVTPAPAPILQRFAAGVVDLVLVSYSVGALGLLIGVDHLSFSAGASNLSIETAGVFAFWLLYFGILEGRWGASLGKRIFRLSVVGTNGQPPGFRKALARAFLIVLMPAIPTMLLWTLGHEWILNRADYWRAAVGSIYYIILLAVFSTMRKRNGFAGFHDLITSTRVVRKPNYQERPSLTPDLETAGPVQVQLHEAKIGPYHVLETLNAEWTLAYDARLLRKTWVRSLPAGTAPHAAAWRQITRPGRLRWLAGRRAPDENWDAFEAPAGRALIHLLAQEGAQPWNRVRFWLLDLATEWEASAKAGDGPDVWALDRIWITADGQAKILDFPVPGVNPTPDEARHLAPREFLERVASASLPGPLPLHARAWLNALPGFAQPEDATRTLGPLIHRKTEVTRWRRAALIAGCLAFPIFVILSLSGATVLLDHWQKKEPATMELSHLLNYRRYVKGNDEAFAVYIASHYRAEVGAWSEMAKMVLDGPGRQFAEASVAAHPNPAPEEIAKAEAQVEPILESMRKTTFSVNKDPNFTGMMLLVTLGIYVMIPALLATLIARGGVILRIAGLAVVREKDGLRAGRWRVLGRALIAWAPVLASPFLVAWMHPTLGDRGTVWVMGLLIVIPALVSLALPIRGLHDRLSGTRLVMR